MDTGWQKESQKSFLLLFVALRGRARDMQSVNPKGKPVPVRFKEDEQAFLSLAAKQTGMPASELVRRAVRLLRRQRESSCNYAFLMELAA